MKSIKRVRRLVLPLLLTVILCSGMGLFPPLAQGAPQSEVNFHVRALLPSNQINSGLSYFDLRMTPSQTQQLEVEITNTSDEALVVNVEAITASTNRNGIIDYKMPDVKDESLRVAFSEISTVETPSLSVPAQSSKVAVINIAMPKESYDGVILGGLVFTRENSTAEQQQSVTIENAISYVLGVKLSITDAVIDPRFELVEVLPRAINYQPSLVHAIRNLEAIIIKGMSVEVLVRNADGTVYAKASKTNIDMAPNSIFPFGLLPEHEKLEPGTYSSEVTLTYDKKEYRYSTEFVIEDAEAEAVNSISPGPQTSNALDLATIAICLVLVLLVSTIILLVILLRKKRRAEE